MALGTTNIPAGSALPFIPPTAGSGSPSLDTLVALNTGTYVCNGVTPVTVADTGVTATSIIVFTLVTVGGTVGAQPVIATITPGTGFTAKGTASDSSTYNWLRIG